MVDRPKDVAGLHCMRMDRNINVHVMFTCHFSHL